VLILGNDGGYYSLKRLSKRQLQTALNVADFKDIKRYIEAELKERG
jgi:hypothetical protein